MRAGAALLLLAPISMLAAQAGAPKFLPDDPLLHDRDTLLDASGAQPQELSQYYDFLENTFGKPGDRRDIPAMNVNTLDEVPDSSWFTNRIVHHPMSEEEVVRGPDRVARLDFDDWTIVRDKGLGAQPGFRAISTDDPTQHIYQLEFDPPSHPELATGAEMIGTAIYHAIGYHVVDAYLVELDPAKIVISPKATIRDRAGRRRRFEPRDLEDILDRAAKLSNGHVRALASRFAEGKPMGEFRYYGTRLDDPNDVCPHEHRRELRASRVFAAWVNHDDSRANNTLDMLVGPTGARYIKHYMFDFGSILGSGTDDANTARQGHAHLIEGKSAWRTLFSFGLWAPRWMRQRFDKQPPSVGRFDSANFEPQRWRAEYPNAAFENMRADDAFWGARRVTAFSDRLLRRIVEKAQYSDPKATDYIARTLAERRDRIARAWLTGVTPIVNVGLSEEGALTFENAAVAAGAAPARYTVSWSIFDNVAGRHEPVGTETTTSEQRAQAPPSILNASGFICATIRATHADFPQWKQPVQAYFRRSGQRWVAVGLVRNGVSWPPDGQTRR